ncbi:hypothetical protein [Chryseobacterium sp. MA9]|uniref:hypothetical protein n=1 Tax=Chryseobacterium sp. MA9 TaxID=2966625 RepID=UPI002107393E|nr:hypothetical protein [Chryseobacterium sp. MA9]UTX50681.1 hypothetical protein KIK00_10620 [Chryseobacterium sp. MA9]
MKKLALIIAIFLCGFLQAQFEEIKEKKWLVILLSTRIEGTSMDNKAFLSIGTKLTDGDKNYYSLRGHFNWWDERKLLVIPEFDYFRKVVSFRDDAEVSSLYAGAGVSPYAVSPKAGISFYHFFCAEFGYNFEYNTYKPFPIKGFRYGMGINLVF